MMLPFVLMGQKWRELVASNWMNCPGPNRWCPQRRHDKLPQMYCRKYSVQLHIGQVWQFQCLGSQGCRKEWTRPGPTRAQPSHQSKHLQGLPQEDNIYHQASPPTRPSPFLTATFVEEVQKPDAAQQVQGQLLSYNHHAWHSSDPTSRTEHQSCYGLAIFIIVLHE